MRLLLLGELGVQHYSRLGLEPRMSSTSRFSSPGESGKGTFWVFRMLSISLYVTPAISAAFQTVIFMVLTWPMASSIFCLWIASARSSRIRADLSTPFLDARRSISSTCDF